MAEAHVFSGKWFTRLGINARVLLLILPPVTAMLLLSDLALLQRYHQAQDLGRMVMLSSLSSEIGALVDELQMERDATGVVLGSQGGEFRTELAAQRQRTSGAADRFVRTDRGMIVKHDAPLARKIKIVRADLLALNTTRARIDSLSLPPLASFRAYTRLIADLLDIVPEAGATAYDSAAGRTFLALFDLMQAKERASQERAIGAQGFATGHFSDALYHRFGVLKEEQDSFLRIFSAYATPEQREILEKALHDHPTSYIDHLRRLALNGDRPGDLNGIHGSAWFNAATVRIALMRDVEISLSRHLEMLARSEQAEARAWFRLLLLGIGALTGLVFLFSVATGRSLSMPIRRMTHAMTQLAGGDNDIMIPDRNRGDEIGAMAAAVEVFRANAILRQQSEAQIAYMARHDALTDLPNRLMFQDRIQAVLTRVSRARKAAVMCLDLDNFKAVNDTLGHPVGDELLRAVAARLNACIGENDIVARLGGDEFAIIQTGEPQPGGAKALARKIVQAIGEPFNLDGHHVVVGASIGIAVAPVDGKEPLQLLRNADVALYHAKSEGRNTFRFFETEMDARLRARRQIETDMREALSAEQFELFYQPLVDAQTGQIVSFEALLRWAHPIRGRISPADFVPVAEETGLIVSLGEWALGVACAEAVKWPEEIAVAVNLSPVQFKSNSIVNVVEEALRSSGLHPSRLGLEVTESLLLQDNEVVLEILHRLRAMGVRISLDDFGTGYSSLSYLRSFPFDKLKIDQCFVRGLGSTKDTTAIVRAVAALGKSMQMKVTAEGVETEDQLHRLQKEGCNEVQGFLFSPPQPASHIPALLKAHWETERNWKPATPDRRSQDRFGRLWDQARPAQASQAAPTDAS